MDESTSALIEPASRSVIFRKTPASPLQVDLYSEDWDLRKGAMVQETATLIRRGPQFRKIRRPLYKKCAQYQAEAALEESDSVILEVTSFHVSDWGID